MDEKGRVRCPHGFGDVTLRVQRKASRARASAIMRGWAELLDAPAKAALVLALRAALTHRTVPPSPALRRAAVAWRVCCVLRREHELQKAAAYQKQGGRPRYAPCGCPADGMRRDIFGTAQRSKRPRVEE